MSNKKISPHQMRKNLTYVQQGPDFMRMLTGQSADAAYKDPRNPYKKPIGIEAKFQTDDPSDDEDENAHDLLNEREEERPTVVVLKDGKHLDERQVRNVLKNLPPGLSDLEIQKRLAEETEKLNNGPSDDNEEEQEEEEEEDQDPVDTNGKILFRKPKGSRTKSKKESITSASSKKSFGETLLAEAEAKVNALKRKSGASSSAKLATVVKKGDTSSNNNSSSSGGGGGGGGGPKAKKQKSAKATSLLSFDDEE
ncbi:hypothetical protein BC939DRAFT_508603 [Gamsiella multidivaricata]|uniref:uncharacterized protein n=1 Tax=Gamsiella multidivaricata TaxID=101098 RepID=UPI0022208E5D|nr:uncharacterized protein BC939DRAFT_508603 [Gamsiella multidivaricata]KAG0364874.1 hypothetical protein BGZ54_007079 [Gamsiella multidivaricata]KAI7816120.1 hypothetical protein BC939DRAFT_508603 [Gamsiella multidivaricata]